LLAFCLLLVIPYFYGGAMGAIRQGLGLNFVLISLMRKDSLVSTGFLFSLFLASLFHVIFFVFLSMALFYKVIQKLFNSDKYILFVLFMFVMSIGVAWKFVTPYLSASQNYSDFERTTSGLSFIGWAVIFSLFSCSYFNLKRTGREINEARYLLVMF